MIGEVFRAIEANTPGRTRSQDAALPTRSVSQKPLKLGPNQSYSNVYIKLFKKYFWPNPMSPKKSRKLQRPLSLRQLADSLNNDSHTCLVNPFPFYDACNVRFDSDGEAAQPRILNDVRIALNELEATTNVSDPALINRLRSVARDCCCLDHRTDDKFEHFAHHWIGFELLDSFLKRQGWQWDMNQWSCLRTATSNSCSPFKKGWGPWGPPARTAVYCSLNRLAIFAQFPGCFDQSFLRPAIDKLVKHWICRSHKHDAEQVRNELRKSFLIQSNVTGSSLSMTLPNRPRDRTTQNLPAVIDLTHEEDDRLQERSSSPLPSSRIIAEPGGFWQKKSTAMTGSPSTSPHEIITPTKVRGQGGSGLHVGNMAIDTDDQPLDGAIPFPNRNRRLAIPVSRIHKRSASAGVSSISSSGNNPKTPERPLAPKSFGSAPQIQVCPPDMVVDNDTRQARGSSLQPETRSSWSASSDSAPVTPIRGSDAANIEFTANSEKSDRTISLESIGHTIFKLVQQPAKAKSNYGEPNKDGWIYILRIPEMPGYVKIGRTTQKVQQRRNQIAKCKKKIELELVDDYCYSNISNHERVENLIHEDLKKERCFFHCPCARSRLSGSGTNTRDSHGNDGMTQHGEWFMIDESEASRRVEKWREWMRQEPYDENKQLKEDFRRRAKYCEKNMGILEEERRRNERWKTFMTPFFMVDRERTTTGRY